MLPSDLIEVIERDHRADDAIVRGDPEPKKRLFSHADDVSLANPLGPPARGWEQVEAALERAVRQFRDGEPNRFERIAEYATADLAYIVEIERSAVRLVASDEGLRPFSLRATTIYRREAGEWRIVHRHADPITSPRPAEFVFESGGVS